MGAVHCVMLKQLRIDVTRACLVAMILSGSILRPMIFGRTDFFKWSSSWTFRKSCSFGHIRLKSSSSLVLTLLDLKSKVLGTWNHFGIILEPFSSCKLSRTIPLLCLMTLVDWLRTTRCYHPMTSSGSSDVSPRLVAPGTIVWLLRNRLGWRCWTSRVTRWADLTTEWSPFLVIFLVLGVWYTAKNNAKKNTLSNFYPIPFSFTRNWMKFGVDLEVP